MNKSGSDATGAPSMWKNVISLEKLAKFLTCATDKQKSV